MRYKAYQSTCTCRICAFRRTLDDWPKMSVVFRRDPMAPSLGYISFGPSSFQRYPPTNDDSLSPNQQMQMMVGSCYSQPHLPAVGVARPSVRCVPALRGSCQEGCRNRYCNPTSAGHSSLFLSSLATSLELAAAYRRCSSAERGSNLAGSLPQETANSHNLYNY